MSPKKHYKYVVPTNCQVLHCPDTSLVDQVKQWLAVISKLMHR